MAESGVHIPATAHTLAGFREWATSDTFPERGRISFLDGELHIDMSPEEINIHNAVKTEVTIELGRMIKQRRLGRLFSDRVLLTNAAAKLSTEADLCFAFWKTLRSGRLRRIPKKSDSAKAIELKGTPDWVLEVISDTSVKKDTRKLKVMYHRAGIPEYWLIDARGEETGFQILVRGEEDYMPASAGRGGWTASAVFKRRFRLIRERGPAQMWLYELETKPLR